VNEDRDRALERALLFNFVIHFVAMAAMALLLARSLPGGGGLTDAERVVTIASHPWVFRLGWLPWQLCAVGDLWMAVAMVRVRWLPRWGSVFVLVATALAVIPDQYAQAMWVTRGVALAQTDSAAYLDFERALFPLTAGWGALLYTIGALGWTYCFARAGTWSRALTLLSVPLWTTMLIAVTAPLLPLEIRPSPRLVSIANGFGFTQLQVWLGLVTEEVLRRTRPTERDGRLATGRDPTRGIVGRVVDAFGNSRLLGALLAPLRSRAP